MNKQLLASVAILGTFSSFANADLLGASVGADFWYADAKVNDVRADDAKFQQSYHASFEHFIPIVPNAKVRYTQIDSSKSNTDAEQYDLIAYYEVLDNSLLSLDLGFNFQHITGKLNDKSIGKWVPNIYADGAIGIPGIPLSLFATFSVGELSKTKTIDAEAGLALSVLDIFPVTLDVKAGYRIIDHDFNYYPIKTRIINNGFFLGVEIDI